MFSPILFVSALLQFTLLIQAQSISPLTTPHSVQATNSTVVITATAFPESIVPPSALGLFNWEFNGTRIAVAGYWPFPVTNERVSASIYSDRVQISTSSSYSSNFTSRLVISQLKAEEDGFLVRYFGLGVAQSLILKIQDCNSSFNDGVTVETTSRIFNSSGKFVCSNEGDLFYSNGTMLTSSDTTCLASAEWEGPEHLLCWKAPSVSLASSSIDGNKLTVIEGNDLNLTCHYDDVIPAGNTSTFYIGTNSYDITIGQPFTLTSLQRSDNNKVVSCQAVTPYTDAYPGSGRSLEYTLDVLFTPNQLTNTSCIWTIDQPGVCEVMFVSNPQTEFISLTLNEKSARNDDKNLVLSHGIEQRYFFKKVDVTSNDEGAYALVLSHALPPYNYSIAFNIAVINDQQLNVPAILVGTIAAVILVCLIAVILICLSRRKPPPDTSASDTLPQNHFKLDSTS
ncbi:uncharacterized protein LOC143445018 [Clavelina lepadiformis]|uniref:uncharacterized protein LOC143445018 n=1 Tax=Clavelina lepadiformis TaxID=159417 RepID=UPI004041CDE5